MFKLNKNIERVVNSLLGFCLVVCAIWGLTSLGQANIELLKFEKNAQIYKDNVPTANYNAYCTKTIKTIKANKIYLAINRKAPREAYYYGCDGAGCKKITVILTYSKERNLKIDISTIIEGPLAETEGQAAADGLINIMQKELSTI